MFTHYSVSKIHTLKLHYCDLRKVKLLESGQTSLSCIQISKLATNTVCWLFFLRWQVHFIFEKIPAKDTNLNNFSVFLSRKSDVAWRKLLVQLIAQASYKYFSSRQAAILLEGVGGASCVLPVHFSSVTQSCPTPCNPMNCSMPGFPVPHQLPEPTQTHVHWVGDAIQPSHSLLSPFPPFLSLS